jgi:hypothetical protein
MKHVTCIGSTDRTKMNNKFEGTWREDVVAYSTPLFSGSEWGKLRKT